MRSRSTGTRVAGPEFPFELALCARLEERTDWVLARQLGGAVAAPGSRVVDVVGVVPGTAFDDRAAVTDRTIPPAVVAGGAGVGTAVPAERAVDASPPHRERLLDRAVEVGFLDRVRRNGRTLYRRTTRYPDDWFAELVAVENKPDLDRPGDLRRQLRHDAALALFDRVVLATASHVTRAHLNRLPDPVGVWRVDPATGERRVVREADPRPVGEPGVEPTGERADRTDVAVVDPAAKRRARRRVAERAYGKGWRTYDLPACARVEPTDDGRPRCEAFDRVVDPASDCGPDCPHRAPADPPTVDAARLRDDRTPWRRDPPGVADRQAGLDRFG
ncbi:MAG: DUF5787 family protein [Haloferacaceae archaeon]